MFTVHGHRDVGQVREPGVVDLAYVAGLIDGEGCVGIRKTRRTGSWKSTRYNASITVGNTNRRLIERLVELFGVGCVAYRLATQRRKGCYVWSVQSKNARDLLLLIRPFLVAKGAQADVLIEFVDGFESFKGARPGTFGGQRISDRELTRRAALYERMRELNQVGPAGGEEQSSAGKKGRGITSEFTAMRRGDQEQLFDPNGLYSVTDLDRVEDI